MPSLFPPTHSRALAPKFSSFLPQESTLTMSGAQGKWMASTIKEKDITQLREAVYLAKEVAHRLPTEGQIIPPRSPMRG